VNPGVVKRKPGKCGGRARRAIENETERDQEMCGQKNRQPHPRDSTAKLGLFCAARVGRMSGQGANPPAGVGHELLYVPDQ
jgi:hypothetical protein